MVFLSRKTEYDPSLLYEFPGEERGFIKECINSYMHGTHLSYHDLMAVYRVALGYAELDPICLNYRLLSGIWEALGNNDAGLLARILSYAQQDFTNFDCKAGENEEKGGSSEEVATGLLIGRISGIILEYSKSREDLDESNEHYHELNFYDLEWVDLAKGDAKGEKETGADFVLVFDKTVGSCHHVTIPFAMQAKLAFERHVYVEDDGRHQREPLSNLNADASYIFYCCESSEFRSCVPIVKSINYIEKADCTRRSDKSFTTDLARNSTDFCTHIVSRLFDYNFHCAHDWLAATIDDLINSGVYEGKPIRVVVLTDDKARIPVYEKVHNKLKSLGRIRSVGVHPHSGTSPDPAPKP